MNVHGLWSTHDHRDPRHETAPRRTSGTQRRRQQVLDAALAITAERGVGAVTIGAIAELLHVTRPVVYSCFPDRVEVIAALLQRETEALAATLVESLHAARGDTPEVAIVTGFQSPLSGVRDRPLSWRFVFFTAPDPAVASRFTRVRAQLLEAVSTRLRTLLTTQCSMPADAAADALPVLAEHVISSCEAAVRSLLDDLNAWTPHDLGELHGRMECRALQVAAQPRMPSMPPVVR